MATHFWYRESLAYATVLARVEQLPNSVTVLLLFSVNKLSDSDSLSSQVAEDIQIDAEWVDKDAHHKLDIIIVLDQSGSVGVDDFARAKKWIRSFLDFFSISPQFAEVCIITWCSIN